MTAQQKYDKAFINTFNSQRIKKEDLICIWDVFIKELWDGGFDGIIGEHYHNEFLHYVMFPRIKKNRHWLVANGGENLVILAHTYKEDIDKLINN